MGPDSIRQFRSYIASFVICSLWGQGSYAQEHTGWGLPEGAIARLGKGSIKGIAYSADGTQLAVAGTRGIWLYDTHSRTEVALLPGQVSGSVAFSPDGSTIAASWGASIRLWEVGTRQPKATLEGHTDPVTSVAFSPDGSTLASGSYDETVRLWNMATGKLKTTLDGHTRQVTSVAFSPDGFTLASASWDRTIRLWDNASGTLKTILEGHTDGITSVVFSPEGSTLASGGQDEVRLWESDTGQLKTTWENSLGSFLAFSPDGSTLAGGGGGNVWLWDVDSGQLKAALGGVINPVISMAISPDGSTLACASWGEVRLWTVDTGQLKTTLEHSWGNAIGFSPDGSILASGSRDAAVRLWEVDTRQLKITLEGHTDPVTSVKFSPDGSTLASGSLDGTIRLWDTDTGQVKATLEHSEAYPAVFTVAFSPDGHTLASGSNGLILWDVNSVNLRTTLGRGIGFTTSVAFSPDGKTIASGSSLGTVLLWDVDTGQPKTCQPLENPQEISSVAFSPNENSPKRTTPPTPQVVVNAVGFSPDGSTLASGHSDGTIRLHEVDTGKLKATVENFGALSVAFSPDGSTVASTGWDAPIRLWEVRTGQQKTTIEGYGSVYVEFSPDGTTLASGNVDDTVLLWDMSPYITSSTPIAVQSSSVPLPTQTALFPNFPNPFNPDTYIPFQLHVPARVSLSIYDVRGALVREIDLGCRPAGQFLTGNRAAHWDGRDHRGERVSSGVYLYSLQAGPIAQVRKMALVK